MAHGSQQPATPGCLAGVVLDTLPTTTPGPYLGVHPVAVSVDEADGHLSAQSVQAVLQGRPGPGKGLQDMAQSVLPTAVGGKRGRRRAGRVSGVLLLLSKDGS